MKECFVKANHRARILVQSYSEIVLEIAQMTKANDDDEKEEAAAMPLILDDQRPNILDIIDTARSQIRSEAKEWAKDEVANLDESIKVKTGSYSKKGSLNLKRDDNDDDKTMASPPPCPPMKPTGLRPGGSTTKGKKRTMNPSAKSIVSVDKRLKDLYNAITHKNVYHFSDLQTTKLRVFVRHDKVFEGMNNWEMVWELIFRMKETDSYIIV